MSGEAPGDGLDGRVTVEQVQEEKKEREGREGTDDDGTSALKEWIGLLVRAGFWALLIYQFVFQVSVVRGNSMLPNFEHGDRLLIDKLSYVLGDPEPGDVVVFEAMVAKDGRRVHRDYIKRIIAGPGEKVKIASGKVYVSGQALTEPWGPEAFRVKDRPTVYIVPPDRYFVLGDRRGDSEDSRGAKIGFVPSRQIKGKVRWRFFPFERMGWF